MPATQIEIDLTWKALIDHYKIQTAQPIQSPTPGHSATTTSTPATATPAVTTTPETATPPPAARKLPDNILIIANDLDFKKNLDDFKQQTVTRIQARYVSFKLNNEITDYAKYFKCVAGRIRGATEPCSYFRSLDFERIQCALI